MININDIIQETDADIKYRVLWRSDDGKLVYVISLCSDSLPIPMVMGDIVNRMNDCALEIVRDDPLTRLAPEDSISEQDRAFRDNLWEKLQDLLAHENEPVIYDRKARGKLVADCSLKTGISKVTLYKHLKRYWQRGMNKNAFLPDRTNAGGKGTKKKSSRKLGRPPKYGTSDGKYIDEATEKIFETAVRKYYHTRAEHTFKAAYEAMIRDFFSREQTDSNGNTRLQLLPENEIPTLRQFQYWYSKTYTTDNKLRFRKGEHKYNLTHRAVTGKSDAGLTGPGAKYQIDATVGDIYLVSQFNRADIIGSPRL